MSDCLYSSQRSFCSKNPQNVWRFLTPCSSPRTFFPHLGHVWRLYSLLCPSSFHESKGGQCMAILKNLVKVLLRPMYKLVSDSSIHAVYKDLPFSMLSPLQLCFSARYGECLWFAEFGHSAEGVPLMMVILALELWLSDGLSQGMGFVLFQICGVIRVLHQ